MASTCRHREWSVKSRRKIALGGHSGGTQWGRVLSVVSSLKSHKGKVQTFCALYHLFPFPCYGNCKYFVTPAITVSVGVSPQVTPHITPPSLLPISILSLALLTHFAVALTYFGLWAQTRHVTYPTVYDFLLSSAPPHSPPLSPTLCTLLIN